MTLTLQLNGLSVAGRDLADAIDLAEMLVALGRAVEPDKWVDELRQQHAAEAFAGLPY